MISWVCGVSRALRGVVDDALEDLRAAAVVDERAVDEAVLAVLALLAVEGEGVDLGVSRQHELVAALERDVGVVAERLGDLRPRDRSDDADLDAVVGEREVPVAVARLAGLVRAQRAEPRAEVGAAGAPAGRVILSSSAHTDAARMVGSAATFSAP